MPKIKQQREVEKATHIVHDEKPVEEQISKVVEEPIHEEEIVKEKPKHKKKVLRVVEIPPEIPIKKPKEEVVEPVKHKPKVKEPGARKT